LRRTAMTVKEQSLETPGPDGAAAAASDGIEDGTSVTLVAGSQDGKIAAGSDARVTRLEQEDAPAQLPKGMEMPLGLVRFDATLAAGRSSEPFSLYVDPALDANGYWVRDNAGTWVNLASGPYGGKMAIEGGRLRLDFSIQDGGPFDADGRADGSVTASGAAARMPLSIAGQTQDVEHGGIWI
ncbi:choice-of-anchor U domain-containing protein, partial [Verminephrobacter aporrectodeae]